MEDLEHSLSTYISVEDLFDFSKDDPLIPLENAEQEMNSHHVVNDNGSGISQVKSRSHGKLLIFRMKKILFLFYFSINQFNRWI